MCAKVVILPDSANSFPFFLMSVKVEITWRWARLKSKVIEIVLQDGRDSFSSSGFAEGRMHLGIKNKQVYFVLLSVFTTFAGKKKRL